MHGSRKSDAKSNDTSIANKRKFYKNWSKIIF